MTDKLNALHFAGDDYIIGKGELTPELRDALLDCSTPGQPAVSAVKYVMATFSITGSLTDTADMLRPYGAWEDDELTDLTTNLERLVWLTGCVFAEDDGVAYFSTY